MKYQKHAMPGVVILVVLLIFLLVLRWSSNDKELIRIIVVKAPIKITIQATGNVEPLNKVELLPPIAGRIDKILIKEGQTVKEGETIAWMSSTNRAALLDIARNRSPQGYEEWKEMYKPTPLIAPVDGLIISKKIVPGQTVTQETILFEMSDILVVRAQVDETDIDKIKKNMKAELTVDAYPDRIFKAHVNHIGLQSELVNNVNIYHTELFLENPSDVLRSGMTANVNFIIQFKPEALVIPNWAVQGHENEEIILLNAKKKEQKISLGMADEKFVEIISPIQEGSEFYIRKTGVSVPSQNRLPNSPFDHKKKKQKK